MSRIGVGFDGSASARQTVEWALDEAVVHGWDLHVITVLEQQPVPTATVTGTPERVVRASTSSSTTRWASARSVSVSTDATGRYAGAPQVVGTGCCSSTVITWRSHPCTAASSRAHSTVWRALADPSNPTTIRDIRHLH